MEAKYYGDKKAIKIVNSISAASRADFMIQLSNKTSEMKLSPFRKNRLMAFAEERMKELNLDDKRGIKEKFVPGMKLKLIYMNDKQAPPPGTIGTVMYVDDAETVHVQWETGSTLGLIPTEDKFTILT